MSKLLYNLRKTWVIAMKSRTNIELKPNELGYLIQQIDKSKFEKDALQAKLDEMTAASKQVSDYADELFADCATFLNERDALRKKLDIALEALQEIYKRYEHGRGSGAGMVANRALKKLEE